MNLVTTLTIVFEKRRTERWQMVYHLPNSLDSLSLSGG